MGPRGFAALAAGVNLALAAAVLYLYAREGAPELLAVALLVLAFTPVDAAIVYGFASSVEARMRRLEERLRGLLAERVGGEARIEGFLDSLQAGARGERGFLAFELGSNIVRAALIEAPVYEARLPPGLRSRVSMSLSMFRAIPLRLRLARTLRPRVCALMEWRGFLRITAPDPEGGGYLRVSGPGVIVEKRCGRKMRDSDVEEVLERLGLGRPGIN